ncbi:roadblock/LC7 domain-containing protein [Lentzea sp. NBC_00516]|uniref:roadblock/LC7 domain-containing protein n=1 Tax=Lentzea sp. NBC_00516 TaxID=2903582 RepID=UPI002E811800|nr:roadblock/LC7 domain-containing protein [Lentzea sp. NBC_00516]WUD26077.1 roadblock/LC7 domain-containing protein [Lentzea sp. NBC_00516]
MSTQPAQTPGALPLRRRGPLSEAPPAPERQVPASAVAKLMTEALEEVHGRIDSVAINGVLVATRDGLVLCGVTRGIEDDGVAAMASAAAGLATQFTSQARVGSPRAVFFEGESGQVGVFGIDADTLLVVLGERDTTMGMFNVVAKQALTLLQQAVAARR